MNLQAQVGKTTTAFNLVYALALMNKRVTLIDLDPESQLTKDCGMDASMSEIDKVLLEDVPLLKSKVALADGLSVIPSGESLIAYEQQEGGGMSRGYQLKRVVDNMKQQDFIVIDCTAKPGLLALNALLAADEVLITTNENYISLQGLVRVMNLCKRLKLNTGSKKVWLALTQVTTSSLVTQEIKSKLLHYFPERVLNTTVRHDEALVACRRQRKAIFNYQQGGLGAEDYFSLAQDIIEMRVS